MTIADINEYWKKPPKPENGLPEDGEYYARAGLGSVKNAHDYTSEFLEIPITVEEGPYAGEKVDVVFFYQLRGAWNSPSLERLKKLHDQVDPRIRTNSPDFLTANQHFMNLLNGRKVKLEQRTSKDGKTYLELKEVFEGGGFAPQSQAAPPTQTQAYSAPPMVDDRAPWP